MSDQPHWRAAVANNEPMSVARFEVELRRGVQSLAPMAYPNALADVVQSIKRDPALPQSRLLTRLLSALITQVGEFRSAEVFAFDTKMRAVVVALLNDFASGVPARDEWQRAFDSADAAQRAYG